MWQAKYASTVHKNLGLGFDFRPCNECDFTPGVRSPCSLRKPVLQRRMFKLLSKKEEKKRDQPSFAEGGVFTYENESIIAI